MNGSVGRFRSRKQKQEQITSNALRTTLLTANVARVAGQDVHTDKLSRYLTKLLRNINMSENFFTPENEPAKFPSDEEIRSFFDTLFLPEDGYNETTREVDDLGIYQWMFETRNEAGEVTEYTYSRQGPTPIGNPIETTVYVSYYDSDGGPTGGNSVAKFINGEWVKTL